nr:two-component regulator propeller domain-containing protein [Dysgonomonas hofstadii]
MSIYSCLLANEQDYIFSKIDYQQGLSNSAILCLFQDNAGLMWFGTYDGLNCYDGKGMDVYRSDLSKSKTLINNVITNIQQADNNCLWVSTNIGATRFSLTSRQAVCNYEFDGDYVLHSNKKGNTWALGYNWISYYNTYHRQFVQVPKPNVVMLNADYRAFATDDGDLYMFPYASGDYYRFSLNAFDQDTLTTQLTSTPTAFHPKAIEYIFYQNGVFCFYDSDKDLYLYDISRKSKIYIRNIAEMVQKYGDIRGIVPFYEDIMIAFRTNGLIRLRTSRKYEEEMVNQNARIFSIHNDPNQGILWVGSDGQGVLMYSKKYSIATNLMLSSLSPNLSRQVRSLFTDKYGSLWFGTKGDGLLHVEDYRKGMQASKTEIYSATGKQNATSYVKWNTEFQVYSMTQSRYMNGFWVGTGASGLLYYSFDDKKLHPLTGNLTERFAEIHSIYEDGDSVLYVATSGTGFHKILLDRSNNDIRVKSQKRYHFYHKQQDITLFFSMVPDGDSLFWLGSQQKGLVRFNRKTEEYQVISLHEKLHKSADDILSLHKYRDGQLYVGTTTGLVCLNFKGQKMDASYIGREQGLLNDMIHSILEDDNGLLWLGTNRGLIKFNPKNQFSHAYYYSGGIQIGEFSDDAYYRCPYTGSLFFGGIDGLLYLDKEVAVMPEYSPDILLRRLMIGRTLVNLGDYYTPDGSGLRLHGAKVSFSLSFVVPDYVSRNDVEYSYMLEGYEKEWGTFSSVNEASYAGVPAGDYIFKVRYKKDVFDTEYKTFSILIHILPPWYQTTLAYIIYILLASAIIVYIIFLARKYLRNERMMKKLLKTENQNTSLTANNYRNRELLNNFTLIYQACDQLRAENVPYADRCKKVEQIREAIMSLLFSFDAGKEEIGQLSSIRFSISGRLSLSELSDEVFRVLEKQGVDTSHIHSLISENFSFQVYKNLLRCILYYCYLYISDKSTSDIQVNAVEKDGKMLLSFQSSDNIIGKLYEIFSHKNISFTGVKGADPSFLNEVMQHFILSALEQQSCAVNYTDSDGTSCLVITFEPAVVARQENDKKTVLLLEDKDEMIWLISELLSDEYTIIPVKSIQDAFEEIHKSAPTLFLVDMLMYTDAESTFIEYVNKYRSLLSNTAFVPMLTWKASSSIQQKLILWADSYIVLPYDILFLKEVIYKVIYGKQVPKQIYVEELSDWADSLVCTTTEQADFIRKFLQVIELNLDREDLGSTLVSEQMAMSSRQFYRKFKEISGMPPSDLIKKYRMEKAARLLADESLSIQDVISDVGISSRSYFYKEFTRRFGMTPKDYREQYKRDDA